MARVVASVLVDVYKQTFSKKRGLLTVRAYGNVRKMSEKKLFLFDVDGTLTQSRKDITPIMKDFLVKEVCPRVDACLVGGSDFKKISGQMGGNEGKFVLCVTTHVTCAEEMN